MAAFGIKAIQPQDNEHIFGFATARGTADMALLEVWNGPTQSDLRFTIDKEGQLQGRDGSAARPTYSFETDKDTGRYLSGAASMLDVVAGTAVGTWTAGKLTLVQLQVDNINVNGNTISSTAGTDLLITPLSGQQIVLDGTIIIDAGVVTGATSITSSSFVGALTGNADSATTATTATTATNVTSIANDSTNETVYPTFVDGQTGAQGIETDVGLTYNPSTGVLTATSFTGALTGAASTIVVADSSTTTTYPAFFDSATGSLAIKTDASNLTYNASSGMLTAAGLTGPLTGNASTATALETARTIGGTSFNGTANIVPATITVADTTNTSCSVALFESATGDLAPKSDSGLTYNAGTGMLTATGLTGPLTGLASTSTLAATVTVIDSSDTTAFPAFFDSATGSLAIKTDASGLTYNATTGVLSAVFSGNITGNVTGNASGSSGSCTGNAATATALATARNIGGTSFDGTGNIVPATITVADTVNTSCSVALFESSTGDLAPKSDGGLTYNAGTGVLTAAGFVGPITGAVTGTASVATTVTITDNESASESNGLVFTSGGVLTGNLGLESDGTLTYNPSTGKITATGFIGALTGDASGSSASCTGNSVTATTAALATSVTASANNSADETVYPTFVDGATGTQGIETDTGLTYNPSSGILTTTQVTGALAGNASTATLAAEATILETARTIGGTSFDGSANIAVALAATATALASARTIGGVSFDGTGNITPNTFGASSFGDANITNVGDIALDSVSSDGSTAPWFTGTGSGGASALGNSVDNASLFIKSNGLTGAGMAIGVTSGGDPYLQGVFSDNTGTKTIILNPYGDNVQVTGSLSKGGGSFLIPHPLPSMNDTHNLVHSFVEGPRADLIYRDSVTLSGGTASVDLDEVVGMTDGTWELLCRDPQVYLQNDTGWAALQGSVSGSTLLINCENTNSTDTVSWMVVAERQDDFMKASGTDFTDSDGRPILEPLKRGS